MARLKNHSALLSKYKLMYEKKPRSRVFAPLAETYRKLGMIEESLKILKMGIRNHPSYTLGYIVLANCYYDKQNFEMAYSSIRPFVAQNLENITLQKLFGKTCLELGHLDEALNTFKQMLLINPNDTYVAQQVKLLEDDLLLSEKDQLQIETNNNSSSFDENEWVQVDFSAAESKSSIQEKKKIEDWQLATKSPLDDFKEEIKNKKIEIKEHRLDDEYFFEEYDNESDDVILPEHDSLFSNIEETKPIITHTLVDLYCGQGHFDKALDVLKSILELHPNDISSQHRFEEIKTLLRKNSQKSQNNETEKIEKLKITFDLFLSRMVEISKQKTARV